MNLTTQDEQVACFENAATHLEGGGRFVVEVQVPNLRRLPPGDRVRTFDIGRTHFGFDEYTDFAGQVLYSHHYWTDNGKLRAFSAPYRWVWPAELDLMARLAGMTLRERWSSWKREPFTGESDSHVSVWENQSNHARYPLRPDGFFEPHIPWSLVLNPLYGIFRLSTV